MDFLIQGIASLIDLCGIDNQFVGALPTALMKPLSGSGARGLMVDAMSTYGADSFVGRLACIFRDRLILPSTFWPSTSAVSVLPKPDMPFPVDYCLTLPVSLPPFLSAICF